MSERLSIRPAITLAHMTAPRELVARLRADVDALRDDIERLHDLPEPDRIALEEPLRESVEQAEAALRLVSQRVGQAVALFSGRAVVARIKSASHDRQLMPLRIGDYRVVVNVNATSGEAVLVHVQAHGEAPRGQPDRASLEALIDQLAPALDIETPAEVLQARRNAEARALLLKEFGALTSSEVADLLGSEARNRSALAHRWRKERRLLAVVYRGTVWFPAFQFHEGEVVPVIREVLEVLAGAGLGEWETALWFGAPSGWLDDRRPVDLLVDEPGRVVDAARFEVAGFGG